MKAYFAVRCAEQRNQFPPAHKLLWDNIKLDFVWAAQTDCNEIDLPATRRCSSSFV